MHFRSPLLRSTLSFSCPVHFGAFSVCRLEWGCFARDEWRGGWEGAIVPLAPFSRGCSCAAPWQRTAREKDDTQPNKLVSWETSSGFEREYGPFPTTIPSDEFSFTVSPLFSAPSYLHRDASSRQMMTDLYLLFRYQRHLKTHRVWSSHRNYTFLTACSIDKDSWQDEASIIVCARQRRCRRRLGRVRECSGFQMSSAVSDLALCDPSGAAGTARWMVRWGEVRRNGAVRRSEARPERWGEARLWGEDLRRRVWQRESLRAELTRQGVPLQSCFYEWALLRRSAAPTGVHCCRWDIGTRQTILQGPTLPYPNEIFIARSIRFKTHLTFVSPFFFFT